MGRDLAGLPFDLARQVDQAKPSSDQLENRSRLEEVWRTETSSPLCVCAQCNRCAAG
jgi:hypothetical protein